jgi:hypothetical protein
MCAAEQRGIPLSGAPVTDRENPGEHCAIVAGRTDNRSRSSR